MLKNALATRQKHIQLADRSEYSWATIKYYEGDPLAANSDDEKSIKKVEKEAQRDAEKKASLKKRKSSANANYRRRRASPYPSDQPGPSFRRDTGQMPALPPSQGRPRVLGPCWHCGAFGHLAVTCTAKEKLYPFCQPVVSSAEPAPVLFESNVSVDEAIDMSDMSAEGQKGVNGPLTRVSDFVMCKNQAKAFDKFDIKCSGKRSATSDLDPGEITKFWEIECIELDQITEVQGHLKQSM